MANDRRSRSSAKCLLLLLAYCVTLDNSHGAEGLDLVKPSAEPSASGHPDLTRADAILAAEPLAKRAVAARSGPKMHIPFMSNEGQLDDDVKFYAPMFAGTVFVTRAGGIVYSLPCALDGTNTTGLALKERPVGGNTPEIRGVRQARPTVSHFVGNSASKWRSNVPTYDLVDLGEIYDGIHLRLKAYRSNVEKLFIVDPGGRPEDIRMKVTGAEVLTISDSGQLQANTDLGTVTFTEPVAYQEDMGKRTPVRVAYAATGNEYGFVVGDYDATRELIIDPLLASTLLGGRMIEGNYEVPVVVNDNGDVYVASRTQSSDFPTTVGAYDTDYNGAASDVFVAKFDADLTTLLASTFIGGTGGDGLWPGLALALAEDGTVYVAGSTDSLDFPTTPGAYDLTHNGVDDAFICHLSGDLGTLLASTLLGGAASEAYVQIDLDSSGAVFLAGVTASVGFPTTPGAYSRTYTPGGNRGYDLFISKFSVDLTTLSASTFLGGSHDDVNEAVRIGGDGSVYVTGWTGSRGYPTTPASYSSSYNGGMYDAFVSRLNSGLTTLSASTFLGGSAWDFGYGLVLDESGFVYVSGHTASQSPGASFPTTPGAYSETYNGDGGEGVGDDAFVSKFDSDLATLVASTFLGGAEWENATFMETDGDGHIYVAGVTSSADYPTTPGAFDRTYDGSGTWAGDVFVSRLNTDLTSLSASTFLGGDFNETVGSIKIDGSGNVYVAGATNSSTFPTTPGAYDRSYNGPVGWDWGGDVFIARIDQFLSADCNANDIHDACDVSCGALGGDCDVAGCGLSDDCNGNFVPDECRDVETDANENGVPDDCETSTPVPANPPHDTLKNRYISIDPNNANSVALRVDLASLKRCSGDDRRACIADDDCPNVCSLDHNLQCTDDAMCGPDGPCVPTSPCVEHSHVGTVSKWVDEPFESSCVPLDDCTGQHFADLGDTPVYRVWTEDVLHITACEIAPAALYEIRATVDGVVFSDPLTIGTIEKPQVHYADCVGPVEGGSFTPPDGFTSVVDVQAYLIANQGGATAPHTTWVDLHGTAPGPSCTGAPCVVPQQILGVADLQWIKFGFVGKTYVETPGQENPGDCP